MENIKSVYEYFCEMCTSLEHRNTYNSFRGSKQLTNRALFICKVLDELGVNYSIDKFIRETECDRVPERQELFYYNIEICFKSNDDNVVNDSLIFISHHDVANVNSENCQDNTASIFNLIELCNRLKNKKIDKNVFVVFTDCEEFGGMGAKRLSDKINNGDFGNVLAVVNSELTGLGNCLWVESKSWLGAYLLNKIKECQIDLVEKRTPFNDSFILRLNNITSVCFGILPSLEIRSDYPKTWMLCHKSYDFFKDSNEQDMLHYVEFLEKLI